MIRAKLFKGLKEGTMNMRTIFNDEKIKLQTGQLCNYCSSSEKFALDHIFPQRFGRKDDAENLIFACKTCNSSKGKKDLLETVGLFCFYSCLFLSPLCFLLFLMILTE